LQRSIGTPAQLVRVRALAVISSHSIWSVLLGDFFGRIAFPDPIGARQTLTKVSWLWHRRPLLARPSSHRAGVISNVVAISRLGAVDAEHRVAGHPNEACRAGDIINQRQVESMACVGNKPIRTSLLHHRRFGYELPSIALQIISIDLLTIPMVITSIDLQTIPLRLPHWCQ
jgi:hypothetical protein